MTQQIMFPAAVNSPVTELAAAIDDVQDTIELVDASKLPAAPNLAVLGSDETAETVLYTGVDGNTLTGVTRGFQGSPKAWSAGTKVARNFTAYDYEALRGNIEDHETRLGDAESGITDLQADVSTVQTDLATHESDYTVHIPYAAATGSANAYAVSLDPAPTAYVEGMALSVKINVDNTAAATLDVNGLGPKPIKKANGNDVAAGNLKSGSVYTLRYNGTNFILQGEGGAAVKSVQRGTGSIPGTNTSVTIPITAVDLTKSIVLVNYYVNDTPARALVKATFVDDSHLLFEVAGGTGSITIFNWQVIEFESVKSLQKGTILLSGAGIVTSTQTITPVDLSKAVIFISYTGNGTSTSGRNYFIRYRLYSQNTIEFIVYTDSEQTFNISWQVVEFE